MLLAVHCLNQGHRARDDVVKGLCIINTVHMVGGDLGAMCHLRSTYSRGWGETGNGGGILGLTPAAYNWCGMWYCAAPNHAALG